MAQRRVTARKPAAATCAAWYELPGDVHVPLTAVTVPGRCMDRHSSTGIRAAVLQRRKRKAHALLAQLRQDAADEAM
eukprot:9119192-Karenia_brevis.AAC.1